MCKYHSVSQTIGGALPLRGEHSNVFTKILLSFILRNTYSVISFVFCFVLFLREKLIKIK